MTNMFKCDQFIGSFHIYITMWMLKAFIEKTATENNVTYSQAAHDVVEIWAERQIAAFKKEYDAMNAGEVRLMKIQHKLRDTDSIPLEFDRCLRNATVEIYKMLGVKTKGEEEKT